MLKSKCCFMAQVQKMCTLFAHLISVADYQTREEGGMYQAKVGCGSNIFLIVFACKNVYNN